MADLVAVSDIEKQLSTIVRPLVDRMGYDLVRLRFGGGDSRKLQIMAERRGGGMELDDCAEISRAVSNALDVADPIRNNYTLEVSSPGIDRPLTRQSDFLRWVGHVAKLETREAVEGRRRFKGVIQAAEEDRIVLETQQGRVELRFDALGAARLVITDELMAELAPPDGPAGDTDRQMTKGDRE